MHSSPIQVLVVEPDRTFARTLLAAIHGVVEAEVHFTFETARRRLTAKPFDFLIANVRLGAYNGLHLVHLMPPREGGPAAIVYSATPDLGLAREVQRAGAFYEIQECVPATLDAYLTHALPAHDRRDPALADRRAQFRGGRRCRDQWFAGGAASAHA
jgi:DNA-binding NtrC family response regulator